MKRYPRNSLAPEAKQALAELKRPKPAAKPVEEVRTPRLLNSRGKLLATPAPQKKSALPVVTGIRHWSTPDYTRVAIDVDGEVKYEAGRVSKPDRIFFDLADTRLASVAGGQELRRAGRISEEDPRSPVPTRTIPGWCWRSLTSPIIRPFCCPILTASSSTSMGVSPRSPTELAKLRELLSLRARGAAPQMAANKNELGGVERRPTGRSGSRRPAVPQARLPPTASGSGAGDDLAIRRPASKPQPAASRPPRQEPTVDEDDNVTTGDSRGQNTTGNQEPTRQPGQGFGVEGDQAAHEGADGSGSRTSECRPKEERQGARPAKWPPTA